MGNYKGYKDSPGHLLYKHFDTKLDDKLIEGLLLAERELYNKKYKRSKLFLENHTLSYMCVGFGYFPPSYINLRKFIAYNSSY
jgi:hypothetical protein